MKLISLSSSIPDLDFQTAARPALPTDSGLRYRAGPAHCDDSCSRVMGSDERALTGSCDRNTQNSPGAATREVTGLNGGEENV